MISMNQWLNQINESMTWSTTDRNEMFLMQEVLEKKMFSGSG